MVRERLYMTVGVKIVPGPNELPARYPTSLQVDKRWPSCRATLLPKTPAMSWLLSSGKHRTPAPGSHAFETTWSTAITACVADRTGTAGVVTFKDHSAIGYAIVS